MTRVLVPLAQGCEELEAGLDEGPVTASRGVRILPDMTLDKALELDYDMVALPGGLPGSDHLAADERLTTLLKTMNESGRFVGAVCAAPKVLARTGLLDGKQATAYPGVLQAEKHANISGNAVTRDGRIITSRSAGTVMDFALAIIEALQGRETRDRVEESLARNERVAD